MIADGIYRFYAEKIVDGVVKGRFIDKYGGRMPLIFNLKTYEERVKERIEQDLGDRINTGKTSFTMVVTKKGKKFKFIAVPQPAMIMGGVWNI